MSRSGGRAGPVFVTTVRAVWFPGRSSTDRSHSISLLKATFLFAAHNQSGMWSSICEHLIDSISETDSILRSTRASPFRTVTVGWHGHLVASGGSGRRISDRSRGAGDECEQHSGRKARKDNE